MNKKFKTILLALLVMLLWGSLFPCVKMGYSAFHIDTSKISNILMFAAMRFTVCGGLVTIYCTLNRKKTIMPTKHDTFNILLVGLFAIILHYACTYIGLSLTDSSKTALLKQAGALIYICFAFLFFKDERFSVYKIIGAIVGFSGIIAINFSSSEITFSYGDLLILGASVCTVVSNIISRKSSQQCSPLVDHGNLSTVWRNGSFYSLFLIRWCVSATYTEVGVGFCIHMYRIHHLLHALVSHFKNQ